MHIIAICLSYAAFLTASAAALLYLIQNWNLKSKHLGVVFSHLPNLSFLDKLNYKSIGLGFPLLSLAIISGVFKSKQSLGVYWSWSHREAGSLILWLVYALILHMRLSSKLRGRKVALLSIMAFFIIIFTLFGKCS